MHPIVAATQGLTGDHLVRGVALAGSIERMTCDVQMGAALHEGEIVLAAIDHEFPSRGRAQGSHATLLLSDRRIYGSLVASNISSTGIDLTLAQVLQIHDDGGFLHPSMTAFTASGPVKFPMYGKQLVAHLTKVLTIPPEHRTLGPLQIAPAPGDPAGAHAAAASLVSGNPVTRALPALAYEAARQGKLPEAHARALLERAVILDRSTVMGRGMHRGQWLTTLPRSALSALFASMLGQPLRSGGDAQWESHDFAVARGGRSAGTAAAASAVGLASAAILGVGFIARASAGLGFDTLRATLVDFPCGSGVTLAAAQGAHTFKLPFAATALLQPLFQTIIRVELRRLLAEVALSNQIPPERLANVARAALEAAVAALGSPLNLGALYPQA